MKLTLVRHGVTQWNTLGKWQGHSDTPLSAAGEQQARLLSRRLREQTFDLVYASDLSRAVRTAEVALPGVQLRLDPRLREVNFGAFDGSTIEQNRLHPLFDEWARDPYEAPTPDGESLAGVVARGLDWTRSLPEGAHVIAFTHSLFIRSLVCALIGIPLRPRASSVFPVPLATPHTSLTVLSRKAGEWALERLGDDSHLESWSQTHL